MITLTGKEVFDMMQILPKFCAENKFPTKVAYRLSRIYKKIESEYKIFDEERIKLVKRHGKEAEPGQYQIPSDNLAEFNQEIRQLFDEIVEINFKPIPIDLLNEIELAPANFVILDKIFTEEPAREPKNDP